MRPRAYVVRPAVFSPTILSVAAVLAALQDSWWYLVALPFIWLGSVCAQPNLNLVNGCLAYLSIGVGLIVAVYFRPLVLAIFGGAMSGLYISAIEKAVCMRPAPEA